MSKYTKTMMVLVVLAVVLAAAGTVVAGGEFVAAATGAAATLVILAVGVPTGKWLWEHAGKLGKGLISLAAVILILTAVVAGWLSGGGEKLATVMATPTPTLTPVPTPLAGKILLHTSPQDAAWTWIKINYSDNRSERDKVKAFGAENLVLDEEIAPSELNAIINTLGITQTVAVVSNPGEAIRYIKRSEYTVLLLDDDDEITYLEGIDMNSEVRVEKFAIPPIEISNGVTKQITEARTAYVILHKIPAPSQIEVARDAWFIASTILTLAP